MIRNVHGIELHVRSGIKVENTIHNTTCESMITVSQHLLSMYHAIVILIKLPELAINDVEMFVREVATNCDAIYIGIVV